MDLIIDVYQQGQIAEAQNKAAQASDRAKQLEREVDDLKRRADALTIASQALWEILRDRLGVDDQTVLRKMQEIDLRDGQADGKISPRPITCPRCARNSNSKRRYCLYCGAALPAGHLFEKI
jgi:hypothetical protein